ncbi:hypothetical protein HY030_00230 [Candidatus Gottesmanbacteria bacterium]|nr:hypothetical protein [Candidatus Gottesmanbacteria bacterium]
MQLQFQVPTLNISKKVLWIGVGVSALTVAGVIILGLKLSQQEGVKQNSLSERKIAINEQEEKPASENVSVYKDPLGYSFSYPDTFTLNNHPEDQVNYSNIDLTNNKSGRIKFIVSDTSYLDISSWQKNDPGVKDANFLDTKIGLLEAKKVYSDLSKKLIIAAIWDGMLFKIEVTPSLDQNLVKVSDKIISSLNIPKTANNTDGVKALSSGDTSDSSSSEPAGDEEVIQ